MGHFKRMAEEADVKVFYVKGNHDNEITEQAVKELICDDVIFIPDKLILRLPNLGLPYYIRFEHGHAYDLFNTYQLTNETLKGKPIGYYISRCAQSSGVQDSPGVCISLSIGKVDQLSRSQTLMPIS